MTSSVPLESSITNQYMYGVYVLLESFTIVIVQ